MNEDISAVCGIVTDFKRFAVHDGDGIRTTVFLKGCPLRCVWCHNLEGLSMKPQLAFYQEKCVGCGNCASACTHGVHKSENGIHTVDRTSCIACGHCVDVCYTDALRLYGKRMSVREVIDFVAEDVMFYGEDGGMTLSGGEPTLQPEFCLALLKAAKARRIHTALDTCGLAQTDVYRMMQPYVDTFLYDIKHISVAGHMRCTGQPNTQILDNLRYLAGNGSDIEIRMPLVPTMNDDEETLHGIARLLSSLPIKKMRILPYHDYAHGKYGALGLQDTLPKTEPPSQERLSACEALMRGYGIPVIES